MNRDILTKFATNYCWECLMPQIVEELINLDLHEHSKVELPYTFLSHWD